MHRLLALLLVLPACGDDGPVTPAADAGPCGADAPFTGAYEDWDSTEQAFLGIGDATVQHVGGAMATTAPNGRSSLCIPRGDLAEVTFTKAGYVTARYTVDPEAALGPYEILGIAEARITTFHEDLGLTYDPAAALVEVAVLSYPSGAPVDGVAVAVGGATGGVHRDASGAWVTGATTDGSPFVVYPNVPITGGGDITLSIIAPAGVTCHHAPTLRVAAGELAVTTVACDD